MKRSLAVVVALILAGALPMAVPSTIAAQSSSCTGIAAGATEGDDSAEQPAVAKLGVFGFAPGSQVEVRRAGADGQTQTATTTTDDHCFAYDPTQPANPGASQYSLRWRGVGIDGAPLEFTMSFGSEAAAPDSSTAATQPAAVAEPPAASQEAAAQAAAQASADSACPAPPPSSIVPAANSFPVSTILPLCTRPLPIGEGPTTAPVVRTGSPGYSNQYSAPSGNGGYPSGSGATTQTQAATNPSGSCGFCGR